MPHPTVLVTAEHLIPQAQELLRQAKVTLEFMSEPVNEARLSARLAKGDVDAVILRGNKPFTARVLASAKNLKLIAKNGAGVDTVDLAAAQRLGIQVAIAPAANADAVAEHALAMMLALVRDLHRLDAKLKSGGWEGTSWLGREFRGSTVGLIGYGSIGRRTAHLARALGANVLVFNARGVNADGFACESDFAQFLRKIDLLTLHCPLTPQTRGLIGQDAFAKMKEGALLVNTARGPIVDEHALIAALQSGRLAGAGLDTFETEPLPANHPLRTLSNVILTPHIAGVTHNAATQVALITARNVLDALAGKELPAHHLAAIPSSHRPI